MMSDSLAPTALVICSTKATCLPVMAASIKQYLPEDLMIYTSGGDPLLFDDRKTVAMENQGTNFGDSYNAAMKKAFDDGHEYIWIANDDIVFHPATWQIFNEDLVLISQEIGHSKLGIIGTRSDYVLWPQNIRNPGTNPKLDGLKWASESMITETPTIAPILAWVSKQAWQVAQFPPTNWYSDNVLCWDLQQAGYRHFVSRAYVHHAGSQTVGLEMKALHAEAWPWVLENRPELAKHISG